MPSTSYHQDIHYNSSTCYHLATIKTFIQLPGRSPKLPDMSPPSCHQDIHHNPFICYYLATFILAHTYVTT
jgi:hypothetical protein